MLSQTPEQTRQLSLDIERLMADDLKQTVSYHISKFGQLLRTKFGLTNDDIVNDIREQIWKGLITHDAKKTANVKTYLNQIIKNRFSTLSRKTKSPKHNMVDYFADVFEVPGIEADRDHSYETGETLLERREEIMANLGQLPDIEAKVYHALLLGQNVREMSESLGLTEMQVKAAVIQVAAVVASKARSAA